MSLERLGIGNIRNIKTADLALVPDINLFLGPNGSGKTSLLEAVYFLGHGRTFRSAGVNPLISRGEPSCTVFGVVSDRQGQRTSLGVSRRRGGMRELKLNGARATKTSALARKMPTLVLGPDTVELLTGSPSGRRRFLNWGVFHVEPVFTEVWEQANRCLRQRNELLRRPDVTAQELKTWDRQLGDLGNRIHALRLAWMEAFQARFEAACRALTRMQDVSCRYVKGWDGEDLKAVLEQQVSGDLKRGYTRFGYQRADLEVCVGNAPATSTCSRGELKVLAWAMVLSQGQVYAERQGTPLVYLVDDLASELDEAHQARVCEFLAASSGQILATGIDGEALRRRWPVQPRVFHVEHGSFSVEEVMDERR